MTPQESNLALCICGNKVCIVPFGICHCGCNLPAKLSDCARGPGRPKRGQPNRYLREHRHRGDVNLVRQYIYGEIDGLPVTYIPVSKHDYAIVDRGWEQFLPGHWHKHNGYACQWICKGGGKRIVYMHHLIAGKQKDGLRTDHKTRNRLDNRALKLRPADKFQNSHNHKLYSSNTSGRTGVYWITSICFWVAAIYFKGRRYFLGRFASFENAVRARERAERILFGDFASFQ